jgi:hypothetical protein
MVCKTNLFPGRPHTFEIIEVDSTSSSVSSPQRAYSILTIFLTFSVRKGSLRSSTDLTEEFVIPNPRSYFITCISDKEMQSWIDAIKVAGPALPDSFGEPHSLKHEFHVSFDKESGKFKVTIGNTYCINLGKGLPPEWEALLLGSGLSMEEVKLSPGTVMNVLSFQQIWRESTAVGNYW